MSYFRTEAGAFLGYFEDPADAPEGAIGCPAPNTTSDIWDGSGWVTPPDADLAIREAAARAACARRISAVASTATQNNLLGASKFGRLSPEEEAVFEAGYDWITLMRKTWRALAATNADIFDDANWPAVPPGVTELAKEY